MTENDNSPKRRGSGALAVAVLPVGLLIAYSLSYPAVFLMIDQAGLAYDGPVLETTLTFYAPLMAVLRESPLTVQSSYFRYVELWCGASEPPAAPPAATEMTAPLITDTFASSLETSPLKE